MSITDKIRQLSGKYAEKIIKVRREIHRNPELSFHEFQTSKMVNKFLSGLKLNKVRFVGNTGVTGIISGSGKKCVALRADLDALPIQEKTDLKFASKNP